MKSVFGFRVLLGYPDLDFENLNPDFPIERTLCVTLLTTVQTSNSYLKRSFSYSRAMLWNNLPKSLKNAACIEHSKRNVKKVADVLDSHMAIM